MLEAHLDPERDVASRPHDRIDAETDWLIDALNLSPGDRVLDLGCGPGLYCKRLADRGLEVTGVDISATAVERATHRAAESDHSITYRQADYQTMPVESVFDAVILVYFDFGTFGDADRNAILETVRDAPVPGGRFAFDIYDESALSEMTESTSWELSDGGFWRPDTHLVLTETITYPAALASLDQHTVIDTSGTATIYRFWERYYDRASIEEMLAAAGLALCDVWADLRGTPVTDEADTYGVLARRRNGADG
ncbi:MAG: methyltransferase domain-containing protein [Halobacteriales archaeon]|nr:methyltransferase domain-containing protein [Halobacteriales archaeon]